MKKKSMSIVIAILVIIAIIIFPLVSSYNNFVSLEEQVNTVASDLDAQLQRRADLIPNLVSTVKGYTTHEEEVLTSIADARSKLAGAGTMEEKAAADSELSNSLSRLLVVVENYPELKANENFKDLTVALEGTENRIAIKREDYNNVVSQYNKKIKRFPGNIVASMFGFEEKQYFKAAEGATEVPKVEFNK
ncbi:LemA family protein [Clostridium senegalense]|uniref:LemA family protein n=1 Tax=Clostridium senegalense TaxID=1465809 RepID=UPI001C128A02|nr:LemA family protein [Clostridium senegalense]MBU5228083.1 LemA family protein [Clostridium senegalense]